MEGMDEVLPYVWFSLEFARQRVAEQAHIQSPIAISQQVPGYVATAGDTAELRRVAEWIGAPPKWDAATKTASLALGGELWQFVPGAARVVSSTGGVFLLPEPVSLQAGRLRVPLEALKIAGTVKWDSTTRIAWFTPKQG